MKDNSTFIAVATLIGSVISCAAFEKGVSLLKGRPFNRKYMWAVWLIVFALTTFVAEFAQAIKSVWER